MAASPDMAGFSHRAQNGFLIEFQTPRLLEMSNRLRDNG
jgi:hypothetical protein